MYVSGQLHVYLSLAVGPATAVLLDLKYVKGQAGPLQCCCAVLRLHSLPLGCLFVMIVKMHDHLVGPQTHGGPASQIAKTEHQHLPFHYLLQST